MEGYIPNLVTGGCGFVGRNLVRRLLSEGEDVYIVDNLVSGDLPSKWLPNHAEPIHTEADRSFEVEGSQLHFYRDDVRSFLPRNRELDFGDIYHLAAVIGGRTTIEGEPLKVASDLSIDADFFNCLVDAEPERVLYASSSAAYPTHLQNGDETVKLKEDHISFEDEVGSPDMTYGWSKRTGEYLSRMAARENGLSVAVVRPFSGYGGEQSFNYPVPAIARRVVREKDPLTVWGTGKQVRDFIHIEDCIEGMMRAIHKISDGSAVNLGTGRPTNFIELATLFADLKGYEPEIKNLPDKPEGVEYRCADTSKMKQELNWEPEISLRDGMERVLSAIEKRVEEENE